MDTVGTFEMADTLATNALFTTIHKHYSVFFNYIHSFSRYSLIYMIYYLIVICLVQIDEWIAYGASRPESIFDHVAISSGISDNDWHKVSSDYSSRQIGPFFS